MKKQKNQHLFLSPICLMLGSVIIQVSFAQPVIVEGIVPNQASKQVLLNKLIALYGANQVIDKIKVGSVAMPAGWDETTAQFITDDLKKISQGKLDIHGTTVRISGKINSPNEINLMTSSFQSLVHPPYRLLTQFTASQAEQKVVDAALNHRIIEFESGLSILTPAGEKILDEMVIALNQVQNKKIKIIGHTDNLGNPQQNLKLSNERAESVKNYLIKKNILADRLFTIGMGSNKPIADNKNPSGRKKNRRIEFEVL